jgi:hypothetical protein
LWVGEINYVGFTDILDLQDFEGTISWNRNGPNLRSRQIKPLFERKGVKFGITIPSALNGEFNSASKSKIVQNLLIERFQTSKNIVPTKSSIRLEFVKSYFCDKYKTVGKKTLCQKGEMKVRVKVRHLPILKWHSIKFARMCNRSELSGTSDLYAEFNARPIASASGGGSSVNVQIGDGYGGSVNVQNNGRRRRSVKVPPDANSNANNLTMPKLTIRKETRDTEVEKFTNKLEKINQMMCSFIQYSSSFIVVICSLSITLNHFQSAFAVTGDNQY